MSDDTKRGRGDDDPSHLTMPPELRPFAKPAPPQRLVAPEDEPEFKAAILALSLINGGPAADPFYFAPKGENDAAAEAVERAKPQAAPSVKVYAPPIAVRGDSNKTGYVDTRLFQAMHAAKVAAAAAREADAKEPEPEPGAIDIRPYQDMAAAHAAAKVEEDETTLEHAQSPGSGPANSPWAKEAEVAPIAVSDLPSSLSPGAKSVRVAPAAESEKAAGVPVDGGNKGVRVMGVLAVVAVIGFAAVQLMPKTRVVEALVPVPVRSAGVAVGVRPQPEVSSGAVVVPSASAVVPAATTEVDAGVSVVPSATVVPVKPRAKIEDPYDAVVPGPAKTAEAVVIPPPIAPVISAAPSISPAPTVAPSAKPSLVGGDKGVF